MCERMTFNLTNYTDFEDFANSDYLEKSDLTIHCSEIDLALYIYNANQGRWYCIEKEFYYTSDFDGLVEDDISVSFELVDDNELIGALDKEFDTTSPLFPCKPRPTQTEQYIQLDIFANC